MSLPAEPDPSLRAFGLRTARTVNMQYGTWPKQSSEFHITILPIPRVLFLKQKRRIHAYFISLPLMSTVFNLKNYKSFHLVLGTLSPEDACYKVSNSLWSLLLLIELWKNTKVFSQNWSLDVAFPVHPLLCVANRCGVVFGVVRRTPMTALLFQEEVSQGLLKSITETMWWSIIICVSFKNRKVFWP